MTVYYQVQHKYISYYILVLSAYYYDRHKHKQR